MKMNKYECDCEDNNCRLESYKRPIFCPYYRNTRSDWRVIDEVHKLENIKDEIPNSGNADVEVPNSGNEVVGVKELWKPKVGEKYYCVALRTVEVVIYTWKDDAVDDLLYNTGNCFKTEEEATKMLESIKQLLTSGVVEQEKATKLHRKFDPGDYVWYKKYSLPAIVDTVVYESDETLYIIKYWDLANCKYAFTQVPEDQLVKGSFQPFSEATFNKDLVGKPVTDRKSGSVYLVTAFITSEYRSSAAKAFGMDNNSVSHLRKPEPLVGIDSGYITLGDLYERYTINGFPCGEFHIEGEEK
jgi:hypothetical protein